MHSLGTAYRVSMHPGAGAGELRPRPVAQVELGSAQMKQFPTHLAWPLLSVAVTSGAECVACGSRDDLVAHHKIPRRYGGLDVLENLEPVCRRCHPRVEQEAIARAQQVWERPDWPSPRRRRRGRPGLIRPY